MATTNVPSGSVSSGKITLTAATVDTVIFADTLEQIDVLSDGTADLYFTTDGSTPTVGGLNCYRLPAAAVTSLDVTVGEVSTGTTVKLISSGTTSYTITRGPVTRQLV